MFKNTSKPRLPVHKVGTTRDPTPNTRGDALNSLLPSSMRIPVPPESRYVFSSDTDLGTRLAENSESKPQATAPQDQGKGAADAAEVSLDAFMPIITQVPVPEETRSYNKLVVCVAFFDVKRELYTHGVAPYEADFERRYLITQVSGLGVGLVVTMDHAPGTVIINECPLLVMPLLVLTLRRNGVRIRTDLLALAVGHLEDKEARLFRQLYNCHPSHGDEVEDAWNIMKTNSLTIGQLPGYAGTYTAVYSDICRINHSSPNAIYNRNLESFTGEVHALRPIKAGEQVFISYLDVRAPYDERQLLLRNTYNFTCACPTCSLSEAERERSDVRRGVLSKFWRNALDDDVEAWIVNPKVPDDLVIKRFLRYASMMEQEMLSDAQGISIARALVLAYSALRDIEGARKWAKKAEELSLATSGSDDGWTKVARSPERTDW